MFRPAEANYEKQACGLHGIALMSTDFEPRGRSFKTGITSAYGTSRHFAAPQKSVAIGVTADIRNVLPLVAHAQGDDEYVAASVLN
jgi:hypothetical protein